MGQQLSAVAAEAAAQRGGGVLEGLHEVEGAQGHGERRDGLAKSLVVHFTVSQLPFVSAASWHPLRLSGGKANAVVVTTSDLVLSGFFFYRLREEYKE